MQNIHLSAYTSHINNQKVALAVRRSSRKSLYCLILSCIFVCAGGVAGSYLHLGYISWQNHRVAVSEQSHLPYQPSALHYIYKNRSLPAVKQDAYTKENIAPDDEDPAVATDAQDISAIESESPEDAPADDSDNSQIMALEKESAEIPLQEWLKKAISEQQQEEKSAK